MFDPDNIIPIDRVHHDNQARIVIDQSTRRVGEGTKRERAAAEAISKFRQWYEAAHPGDSVIYYEGWLLGAREAKRLAVFQQAQVAVADAARAHEQQGLVKLTQKRLGDLQYQYIATRVARRYK